jgi:hypothetical protein
LPDDVFSNQKYQFGKILEGLAMEDVGIFYGHLIYFTAIWYFLLPSGIFYGHLVYISPVLVCCITRNLATLVHMEAVSAPVASFFQPEFDPGGDLWPIGWTSTPSLTPRAEHTEIV